MGSILERPNLNKIFLMYGNLDDMFISPDLQKNNFRPFLNSYLRSLGYEQIVFYSGAKNTGKYVLDDHSAVLAINKNKDRYNSAAQTTQSSGNGGTHANEKNRRRILNPRSTESTASQASTPVERTSENIAADSSRTEKKDVKLIYKQPKITPAEFLDDAKK